MLALSLTTSAAPRRRAVQAPGPLTRDAIVATALKAADRVTFAHDPRLHWENAVFLDGLVLLGEQIGSEALIERAAAVLLNSNDAIDTVYWGDGMAYAQASSRAASTKDGSSATSTSRW